MQLQYHSSGFDPVQFPNFPNKKWNSFPFDPGQLIAAAITVGRPDITSVFQHGWYSYYEMIYRSALILANIGYNDRGHLCKTPAYTALDPTEKGAVSYFTAMTITKLMADKLMGIPYLVHLKVYEKDITRKYGVIHYKDGLSRPDLINVNKALDAYIFEAKGRSGAFNQNALNKAKDQAKMISSIGYPPKPPKAAIAVETYFHYDELHVKCQDPEPSRDGLNFDFLSPEQIIKDYYRPLYQLVTQYPYGRKLDDTQNEAMFLPTMDLTIRLPKVIGQLFRENQLNKTFVQDILKELPPPSWEDEAQEKYSLDNVTPYIRPLSKIVRMNDGIQFEFGQSWEERFTKI